MKQDYTLDELQTEMTALAQLFDSVTLADPCMGLLDPATLQPLNKVAAMPALDAAGRGMKIEKAADGLRTVIAKGITVADTPCVLLLGMPLPRNLQADGAEDAFTRALSQMEDDLRRDYVTGVYNSVYLNEAFRPRAERAALDGKPVGVVMVRVNEYWQLREKESNSAADCCLNMASGILQLVVGPDHDKAVLARLNDGFFAIVTVGTPAAQMARAVNEAMNASRREFNISLSRRGSFTVAIASAIVVSLVLTVAWPVLLQRDPIYPILMARLHAALPGYEFAVDTRPVSRNPHEMLCSEADAALYLPFGPLQPEIERTPILHNTFYLIVSPEHPLTGRSTLALADLAGQQLFYEPLYQEMVDLAVVQPGLPFSAPSWHMVENYECVYNDLLAGRGMFLCPMKYPAFPAAWYLPLQLPLPDTCLLTLRDDPRPEIQRLREVFTAVYASRAKLLGEE